MHHGITFMKVLPDRVVRQDIFCLGKPSYCNVHGVEFAVGGPAFKGLLRLVIVATRGRPVVSRPSRYRT